MIKNTIYTCISNDYDKLVDPPIIDSDFHYICFSDTSLKSKVWEIRPLIKRFDNPSLTSRFHKTQAWRHLDYDNYVWQDGNVTINSKISDFLMDFNKPKYGIKFFKHPERTCIFPEAKAILRLKKDSPQVVEKQMRKYKSHPRNFGLFATYVFRYEKNFTYVLDEWWNELKHQSIRDQLSLPVVVKKLGLNINLLYSNLKFSNKHITLNKHRTKYKIAF